MRRPSVVFMNRVYPPASGATGRMLRDLARSFAREGWRVTVVTTGESAGLERDGAIRVVRVKGASRPSNMLAYLWILVKMTWAALRVDPSGHLLVTLSDPPLLTIAGQVVKRIKGGRHISWCHDLYPDILPAIGVNVPHFMFVFVKRRMSAALKDCDKVIVIGRCMARNLTYNGVDPCHITVIPNWPDRELMQAVTDVPTKDFHVSDGIAAKPHAEQLKDKPRFRVLYAGNIGLAHPTETILDAAEMLMKTNPEVEFTFVGQGERFDEIAEARSHRGLDNIRLMPYQPASKLRALMESGDVHLISMKEEAAGMLVPCKLYSAIAVQRPCIFVGPAGSETAKVIQDFKAGAVVSQGDAKALAGAIIRYCEDGDAWFDAQRGAASAGEVFLPENAMEAWIKRAWSVVKEDLTQDSQRSSEKCTRREITRNAASRSKAA